MERDLTRTSDEGEPQPRSTDAPHPPVALVLETYSRNVHVARTFSHEDIYPPELGCHDDHTLALHGTLLDGTPLLQLCVDNDEIAIAQWLRLRWSFYPQIAQISQMDDT